MGADNRLSTSKLQILLWATYSRRILVSCRRVAAAAARAGVALALATSLASCKQSVDLQGVQKFAQAAEASSDSYAALSSDFYDSCVRAYEWQWAAALSHRHFQALDQACSKNSKAAKQWQDANLALLAYVRALGALAGGDDSQTDFGIPRLVNSINGIAGSALTDSQVKSISNGASGLVTDIFNIRRRSEIATYAPAANSDLDTVIGTLEDVARTNYANQLRYELDAVNEFYRPVAPDALGASDNSARSASSLRAASQRRANLPPPRRPMTSVLMVRALTDLDRVQLLQLRDRYRQDRAAIQDRFKAIDAYVDSLEALKGAHKSLVDAIRSSNPQDVAKIAQAYVDQLRPALQAIQNSFNTEKTK